MKKHPVIYLILGITILIVPTAIYLFFLIPKMTEEYNILMASSGVIGGFGLFGANKIPENLKFSKLLKLAANSFTVLIVNILVQKFINQIIGLVAVIIVSFIIYKIFMEAYKNGKRRKENKELANEIARNTSKNT